MKKEKLNQIRRMAGLPQDFSPEPRTVVEDVVPGMSQAKRGGKHLFYLVVDAHKGDELGDVITEVDAQALMNIVRGAAQRGANFRKWEIFPHNEQKAALDLARERLMNPMTEVVLSPNFQASNPANTPVPNDQQMAAGMSGGASEEQCEMCGMFHPDYEECEFSMPEEQCEWCGMTPCACPEEQGEEDMDDIDNDDFGRPDDEDWSYDERHDMYEPSSQPCPECNADAEDEGHPGCPLCGGEGFVSEAVEPESFAPKFKKGQTVVCHGKKMVVQVPNGKADMVGVVPVGQEGDKKAVKMVHQSKVKLAEAEEKNFAPKFKKGQKVKCGGKMMVVQVPNGKADFVGVVPVGKEGDKNAVKMVHQSKVVLAEAEKQFAPKFKKGDKVMADGKHYVVQVANGKADFVGLVPVGEEGNKNAVKMVHQSKVKKAVAAKPAFESMMYDTDNAYPLTQMNKGLPMNVAADSEKGTIWDTSEFAHQPQPYELADDEEKVVVPARILAELKRVIAEVKAESEKAKPRDWERANYYSDTAEALQTVLDYLNMKTVEGLKRAQVYSQRMMNVSRALMPDAVWKFIIDGGQKRSLKAYMNDVKKNPVVGKNPPNVPVSKLNKNTHTQ